MNTEAPKRIWVEDCNSDWSTDSGTWGASWENDWDVEYVRADIADEMLEALNAVLDEYDLRMDGPVIYSIDKVRAAIAKAEENTYE